MTLVVCLDVGEFDVSLFEFDTECAANWYLDKVQPHCKYPLEVKPEEKLRTPNHDFVLDNICRRFIV